MNQIKPTLLDLNGDRYKLQIKDKIKDYSRVTKIINTALPVDWSMVDPEIMDASLKFGNALHVTTDYWDRGILNEETLHPDLVPYLNGYKKFRRIVPWAKKIRYSELLVWSDKHHYAGTLDKVFESRVIVDLKTGLLDKRTGYQDAAYERALWESHRFKVKRRFGLLVKPDDFRLVEFKSPGDIYKFYQCITMHDIIKEGFKI